VGIEPTSANTMHLKCIPLDHSGNLAILEHSAHHPLLIIFHFNFFEE
jgi:hypothetical protein